MNVKLLSPQAQIPTRGSKFAAGLDLYACEPIPVTLAPGERGIISTGISIEIPGNFYGRVAPRSGLAAKSGINVMAGVIDNDFRSEIKVILINHSNTNFQVKTGDRVAQLIVTPYFDCLVNLVQNLSTTTERGNSGFGSTGK